MTRSHPGTSARSIAASVAGLLSCMPLAVQASSFELKVAPLLSRSPSGRCPQTIAVSETLQPYREGSYGLDGRAPLEAIATGWRLAGRDGFSATWVAQLRTPYQRCTASAGIVRADNAPFRDHSYLRLRFSGGQAQLILDMTGMRDPNGYTPVILSAGVNRGQPVWSWGGSD